MLMNGRAQSWFGPSSGSGPRDAENQGQLYAPLLFKNYNGWSSGMVLSASQTSGGAAAMATVSFYDEGGTFIGSVNPRLSGSEEYLYLPDIEFLPDKYRGTAVVNFSGNSDSPGYFPGRALRGMVAHVNYERNHAMSYDTIGMSAVVNRQEALGELPCISLGFVTCAWAADVWKTGTVSRETTQVGTQTGIRLFAPDPLHTGVPATVVVNYIDDTGVLWGEGTNVFSIPPYNVHTVFPLYIERLPEIFRGSVRIAASGNYVVGIAQTVDYSTMGSDASGAYNLQYHSGYTR